MLTWITLSHHSNFTVDRVHWLEGEWMRSMLPQAQCMEEFFEVGKPCSVEIVLTADHELRPGDKVEFQFPNSWSLCSGPSHTREFQADDAGRAHYLSIAVPGHAPARFMLTIAPRHLCYPEGAVRHGRLVTAELVGAPIPAQTPLHLRYQNTFAPYVAEREELWLRLNGEAPETAPVLRVQSGPHECFRVIVPSHAAPGKPFDVLIVSLDRFENASSTRFENETLALEDGRVVADELRLTGSLRVPVCIEQTGVCRFRFGSTLSNAVKVDAAPAGPYWGDLHIHTKLSHDGQGTEPYRYAREVSGLDFAGVADHWESLGPEGYRILKQWTETANVPDEFVTLPADERDPRELTGHHNVYFSNMETLQRHRAIRETGEACAANSFDKLGVVDASEVILIPHHTGIAFGDLPSEGIGCAIHWDVHDDRNLRPVMEIYSHHGQSELFSPQHLLAYESNRMRNPERRANTSVPGPFYAQDYWMAGQRLGVIGSSDEHSGQGGRRHGGLAAVCADSLTREGIFGALRRRSCYATTGERILVEFSIGELRMGECGQRKRGDSADIKLEVWGTDILLRVEVLRYRFGLDTAFTPVLSLAPRPEAMHVSMALDEPVEAAAVYYARVVQEPLAWPAMAWTSPIWIDLEV